jgi:hypothetical protein
MIVEGVWNLWLAYSFMRSYKIRSLAIKQRNLWIRNIIGSLFSACIGIFIACLIHKTNTVYKSDPEVIVTYAILGGIFWVSAKYDISTDDTPGNGLRFKEYYKKAGITSGYILMGGAVLATIINILYILIKPTN